MVSNNKICRRPIYHELEVCGRYLSNSTILIINQKWTHILTALIYLKIHPDKTKIPNMNIRYDLWKREINYGRINVEILSEEETTSYIGRVIHLRNLYDCEFHNRIPKVWTKFGISKKEMTDLVIPINFQVKFSDTSSHLFTMLYDNEIGRMIFQQQKIMRS